MYSAVLLFYHLRPQNIGAIDYEVFKRWCLLRGLLAIGSAPLKRIVDLSPLSPPPPLFPFSSHRVSSLFCHCSMLFH